MVNLVYSFILFSLKQIETNQLQGKKIQPPREKTTNRGDLRKNAHPGPILPNNH